MEFRTEIEIKDKHPFITHDSSILTIGSCFSTEIGNSLVKYLYDIKVNPYGALFNPVSIFRIINDAVEERKYEQENLIKDDITNIYHSLFHHSIFSNENPYTVINKIEQTNIMFREFLKQDNLIVIITLGSARAFVLKSTGEIVANCHKLSSKLFDIKNFGINEIKVILINIIKLIRALNHDARIIFTVSPVRHKSYGLHTDKLSKAKLLLAIDELSGCYSNVYYFPAYEILIDDLRDYRFYSSDMIHPSDTAIDYIFEKFSEMFMSDKERSINKICLSAYKRLSHISHNSFTESQDLGLYGGLTEIISDYPKIKLSLDRQLNK